MNKVKSKKNFHWIGVTGLSSIVAHGAMRILLVSTISTSDRLVHLIV